VAVGSPVAVAAVAAVAAVVAVVDAVVAAVAAAAVVVVAAAAADNCHLNKNHKLAVVEKTVLELEASVDNSAE